MTQYNNNSAQVQAFKDYQAIPETTFDTMSDFEDFLDNDWEALNGYDEGVATPIIKEAIRQFLMQDEKSQALIKAGEQELLNKWSKNAKNL